MQAFLPATHKRQRRDSILAWGNAPGIKVSSAALKARFKSTGRADWGYSIIESRLQRCRESPT